MKKVLLPAILLCNVSAFAQATLEGNLAGVPDGTRIYLSRLGGGNSDSAEIKGGKFVINSAAKEGDVWFLRAGRGQSAGSLLFYMEPGKLKVSSKSPKLDDATYSGPAYAADQNSLSKLGQTPLLAKLRELSKEMSATYKTDTVRFNAARKASESLEEERKALYEKWISEHTASPVSAYVLSMQLRYENMDQLDKALKSLKPAAKNNAVAKKLQHSVDASRATAIGKIAPEFTQNDTLGNPVALKDFRGKYVLIDFWASWCVPCRKENPAVVKAYQAYKDKNFTVLGVSLDRPGDKDKWIKAIHDDGLTWSHVSDLNWWDNAVSRQYDIRSIPANFLIGPDGKIIAKNLRGEALDKALEEVLK
ncbi:AhpC/TSA family protein [Chitinophaga horti]|uniref:AhpC/TSA family protein n=1 Tax=Chitinophaga horti TaxID=2920382 RepID=A0ABY6J8J0_9BACT|nr:TlpA disulfide reductase family protein [Chitinophaga horti]UYQ94464.1 AhpC/TSA family protein [Chitinophaga horti]